MTNQKIAGKLEITASTVQQHVSNVLAKADLYNRVELVGWALHNKVIDLEELRAMYRR